MRDMEEFINDQNKMLEEMEFRFKQQEKDFIDDRMSYINKRTTIVNEIETNKMANQKAVELFNSRLKIVEQRLGIRSAGSEDVDT